MPVPEGLAVNLTIGRIECASAGFVRLENPTERHRGRFVHHSDYLGFYSADLVLELRPLFSGPVGDKEASVFSSLRAYFSVENAKESCGKGTSLTFSYSEYVVEDANKIDDPLTQIESFVSFLKDLVKLFDSLLPIMFQRAHVRDIERSLSYDHLFRALQRRG